MLTAGLSTALDHGLFEYRMCALSAQERDDLLLVFLLLLAVQRKSATGFVQQPVGGRYTCSRLTTCRGRPSPGTDTERIRRLLK